MRPKSVYPRPIPTCWRCGRSLEALSQEGRVCPHCDALLNPPIHWVKRNAETALRLGFKLAAEYAISVLDSHSIEAERDGEKWLDLSDPTYNWLTEFFDELAFLECVGRLRRHPKESGLVRILDEAAGPLQIPVVR